jgi:uncharacterized protein YlxW (UPF0749 family)
VDHGVEIDLQLARDAGVGLLLQRLQRHDPGVVDEDVERPETLLDLVQELRDAGAEAIAVNGRRVGAATAFSSRRGTLTVDGQEIREPYEVVAIGDPATLEVGLKIPGGAVDTVDALNGTQVSVERRSEVRVPALEHSPGFKAARPVK